MHAISSYHGNRPMHGHTHTNTRRPPARCKHTVANTQTGPITIHCAAKLSALCNNNSEVIQRVFVKKNNPKRAACASLVEREEKGFEVALKR